MAYVALDKADSDPGKPTKASWGDQVADNFTAVLAVVGPVSMLSVFPAGHGGSGVDSAAVLTTGNLAVGDGKQYTSLGIALGETITITTATDGVARIGCTGDCTIAGAIVVNALGAAGGAGATASAGTGVSGTGYRRAVFGATAGGGGGGGSGDLVGQNGGAGAIGGAAMTTALPGGTAGDPVLRPNTGGSAGGAGLAFASAEHVALSNSIMVLSPGTGGGGGGAAHNGTDGGAGGPGGTVLIIEVAGSLTFTGSITCNGGAGVAGVGGGAQGGGGGGGGGGGVVLVVAAAVASQTGTITTNGGTAGAAGSGTYSPGKAGGAGGAGYSDIITLGSV